MPPPRQLVSFLIRQVCAHMHTSFLAQDILSYIAYTANHCIFQPSVACLSLQGRSLRAILPAGGTAFCLWMAMVPLSAAPWGGAKQLLGMKGAKETTTGRLPRLAFMCVYIHTYIHVYTYRTYINLHAYLHMIYIYTYIYVNIYIQFSMWPT